MMWLIVALIAAMAAGIVVMLITNTGLSTQDKNIAALASCKAQGGECKPDCDPSETEFLNYGDCRDTPEPKCCIKKGLT